MTEQHDEHWPDDLAQSEVRSPVAMMREAADELGPKTAGRVTGEVVTRKAALVPNGPPEGLRHTFFIVAPELDYRYELFAIVQCGAAFPLTIEHWPDYRQREERYFDQQRQEVVDADGFAEELKTILHSEEARGVIANLLDVVRRTSNAA